MYQTNVRHCLKVVLNRCKWGQLNVSEATSVVGGI